MHSTSTWTQLSGGGGGLPCMQFSQQLPDFNEALAETLLWAIRHYRAGRQVEGAFEAAIDTARQRAEQAKNQPPQPSPEQIQMQQQAQIEQGRMQMEGQKLQLEAAKIQTERQKVAADAQIKQAGIQVDYEKLRLDAALKLKELQTTAMIKAAEAELNVEQQARQMENVPKAEAAEPKAKATPINISLNMPSGKKRAKFSYDADGNRVAEVEDIGAADVE